MRTEHYPYKLAALYPDAVSVAAADSALRYAHLDGIRSMQLHPGSNDVGQAVEPEQAETRNHFVRDILIGAGIGTVLGLAAAGAIAVWLPSLFANAPILAPTMVVGYVASLAATLGAIAAFKPREGLLSGKVQDALNHGSHVLIVHAPDDAAQRRVEKVVEATPAREVILA